MKKTGFLLLVFLFIFGSMFGWCLEVLYRKIPCDDNPEGKWKNPGLLSGPWLPIYGFGVIFLFFASALEEIIKVSKLEYTIILFFGSAVIMSGMELVGGSFLYNVMHMRLWDYREQKFNYKGYTCAKFFCIWGSVSVAYYYLVSKPIINLVYKYFQNVDIFAYFVGLLWGIFLVDLWNSMGLSIKLAKYAKQYNIYIDFEKVKDEARATEKIDSSSKQDNIFHRPSIERFMSFMEIQVKKAQNLPKTIDNLADKVENIIEDKLVEPVQEKIEEFKNKGQ